IVQSAHPLTALARSPADGRIVAAGTSHVLRTSTDNGASWQLGMLGTFTENYPFLDLVWSPSANAFIGHVMIGANQYAYRSSDGASWTRLGDMPCYGALAASPARMVNVGSSLVGACAATSVDGVTWSAVTPPSSTILKGVFWTGSQFIAVGSSGAIATSADGLAWTAQASGVTATLHGAASSPTMIVVVGSNGTILTSGDGGVTWIPRSSGTTSTLRRAVFTGAEFFVVGTGGRLLRSSDGLVWSSQATSWTTELNNILWLPDVSRLVLVGQHGLTALSP
ncbi:MAG TPA: hypothetical protein VFR86_28690, partial [Burkholderiaceae bacterium]|nr:hypothetical protein [Burkholderiaceae bacterium]